MHPFAKMYKECGIFLCQAFLTMNLGPLLLSKEGDRIASQ